MPKRRLPQSNPARFKAMTAAKDMKDAIPAPLIIPFTPATIIKIDLQLPAYQVKIAAAEAALQLQTNLRAQIETAKELASWLISDFYEALQRAIRRGTFEASVRTWYGLAASDATTPFARTEADVNYWGGKAATGEATRIAAGGAPITFPAIAEVTAAVTAFKNLNLQQANAKIAYDTAQEQLAALNPELDKLILKMWNEIETTFDEGDKPSMRRKAREWGVIYVQNPGEAPSPDEFSIMGKVREEGAGSTPAIEDAEITVVETNDQVLSDNNGDFLVPLLDPGTYTLQVAKTGFVTKTINNVQVSAGVITELDIQLAPVVVLEGSVPAPGIVGPNTTGISFTPATLLLLEALGTGLRFYFSSTPAGAPVPETIYVDVQGGQSANVTAAQLGFGGANVYLCVQNIGMTPGTYRITVG